LECALKTQPNITLISEEVAEKKQTLADVVNYIAEIVASRAENGDNFGVALIPEGLIEFIPEMKILISELNDLLAEGSLKEKEFKHLRKSHRLAWIAEHISPKSAKVFKSLPQGIATQLTLDRDPHGNVQVSLIETEKLLGEMVKEKLEAMKIAGKFVGKFGTQYHFFGYEGRCAAPSNFDADYCYSLGYTASVLISDGKTGYMASVRNLTAPAEDWIAGGVPITMMMNMERRHGHMKPVIQKALVELNGAPFKYFASKRGEWAFKTQFIYPGPIQYFGPTEVCDPTTETLKLEQA
jgi:pyrophosphate--fructose-6-phosphate 1-phosphotransferase